MFFPFRVQGQTRFYYEGGRKGKEVREAKEKEGKGGREEKGREWKGRKEGREGRKEGTLTNVFE